MRSIVCNPSKSECNHFFGKIYVINPKGKTYKAYALMTYRLHCKRITYAYRRLYTKPIGLDKNKALRMQCFIFWRSKRDSNP